MLEVASPAAVGWPTFFGSQKRGAENASPLAQQFYVISKFATGFAILVLAFERSPDRKLGPGTRAIAAN